VSEREIQKIQFQPFDEKKRVRIYTRGFLPHWRQDGCTYFVTFRTADSIPKAVFQKWKSERKIWLKRRGISTEDSDWKSQLSKLVELDQKNFQRYFTAQLFTELDKCCGKCLLKRPDLGNIVANALLFFDGSRMSTGDFVVMPNHAHALLTPALGYELEDLLHSIKSYSASKINKLVKSKGSFWMPETHDHIVRHGPELNRIQDYIRNNPSKAGLPCKDAIVRKATYELS
jgi:REP element-mobilizing transposase RayT